MLDQFKEMKCSDPINQLEFRKGVQTSNLWPRIVADDPGYNYMYNWSLCSSVVEESSHQGIDITKAEKHGYSIHDYALP